MFFNAMNINQLKGRIITEPELKETRTGKLLLVFNLMYFTRQTTNSDGSHTNFIQVEAWEKVAEVNAPHLRKGLEILVNGSIVQKRWSDEAGHARSQFIFSADVINITDLKLMTEDEAAEEAAETVKRAA